MRPALPRLRRLACRSSIAGALAWAGCDAPPPEDLPSSIEPDAPDLGSTASRAKADDTPPAALPDPPADPWDAAGLSALRSGPDLAWPVESVHVTSAFGWRTDPVTGSGTRLHRGVDFRGATGDLVLSIARGEVTFVGQDVALGTMVEVDHGLGITSLYGHLSDVLVVEGSVVERGAGLGLVGNTGRSAAPHLHLTIKIDDVAVDPMMLLGQPLHRATALRAQPPKTRAPAEPAVAPDDATRRAPPVLQP
ncbi:MAG: M23 family metallopeptidase [Myxococcota bacterium]